ncbi:MAG: hypothetical protein EOL98_13935 [Negativicutes bacterium]|jgi:hypothetical protein|nr:hypothetical protein [Negativicutes bacterium]
MKTRYWLLLILIAFAAGYFIGKATTSNGEIVKQVKGETVYGSLNPDFLTVKKEFKGDIKFLPYIFWKSDTIRVSETEYISTIPDTAKIIEDFITKREYQFNVFNNEQGVLDISQSIQYNRLQSFRYTYTPINTEKIIREKQLFTPFLSASYNTFGIAGVGGGFFIKNTGVEYNYLYQPFDNQSGHMVGIKFKF